MTRKRTHQVLCVVSTLLVNALGPLYAAEPLAEFGFRECRLSVTTADGKPVAGASVYGFCRDYNLLWPEKVGTTEQTGKNGNVRARLPGGKWRFFAIAQTKDGEILAAWSEARVPQEAEVISLRPTVSKRWSLCSPDGVTLSPKCIYIRPEGLPIWVPLSLKQPLANLDISTVSGKWHIWAQGDAAENHPSFVMDWGTVSEATPSGKILSPDKPATIECQGGNGKAWLEWKRTRNPGLDGELALTNNPAKVWVTPGDFAFSYRRPLTAALTASFAAETYKLNTGQTLRLKLDDPLAPGLAQAWDNASAVSKLFIRLYLVDANGHPLEKLCDPSGEQVPIEASVNVYGKTFPAIQLTRKDASVPDTELGYTLFAAEVGKRESKIDATWEFSAPEGLLPRSRMAAEKPVTVQTRSFETEVPLFMARHARNVLEQAEFFAQAMERLTGRKRAAPVTRLLITPGSRGGAASHNAKRITIGTITYFKDALSDRHTFCHELGHTYDFYHGALLETVGEATRCFGYDDIGEQEQKWLFIKMMNGNQKAVDSHSNQGPYNHDNGLYFYAYAQGGPDLLRFLSANEDAVKKKLVKTTSQFTEDEITTALLSIGLKRDMTAICAAAGLKVSADRVAQATQAARDICTK